jgi:predicted transcriptional regulator
MNLRDVLGHLDGELLTPGSDLDLEFSRVFASDLMSDVLAFTGPGELLITGLANGHVVSTAAVADIAAVVFVQGKKPSAAVIGEARASDLPLLSTPLPMFEACARIERLRAGR